MSTDIAGMSGAPPIHVTDPTLDWANSFARETYVVQKLIDIKADSEDIDSVLGSYETRIVFLIGLKSQKLWDTVVTYLRYMSDQPELHSMSVLKGECCA